METEVERYGAQQCKAPQLYGGQVYYCLRPDGHSGPHQNDTVPNESEQAWGNTRARWVADRLNWTGGADENE